MKLFYFARKDGIENFGDSLNSWLWSRLIANELDDDDSTAFIGIGTILNGLLPYRLPKAHNFVVFSSGLGYGRGTIPAIDEHWKIYCLRGPLSAEHLGAPANLAIADGALLLKRCVSISSPKQYRYSYMPHVEQVIGQGKLWPEICAQAGIHFISPTLPTEEFLRELGKTEVLVTEAMHGAIAAEALRIPWIPIRTAPGIFIFKWVDWCSSIGLDYQPADIPLQDLAQFADVCQKPKIDTGDDSALAFWHAREQRKQEIVNHLINVKRTESPVLAADERIESLTVRLEEKIYAFKADVQSGHLFNE